MRTYAFRLHKGQDLKNEIKNFVTEKNIKAGVILTCTGSLVKAVLRDASAKNTQVIEKQLEIVSATGTLSQDGCHIHISVSDENLNTYGGHLKDGSIVNTTVEIVLLELDDVIFNREFDDSTGWKELVIKNV